MSFSSTKVQPNITRFHKPSCTESDLATQDSILSTFQTIATEQNYMSNHSMILKQKFSSVNSNNVTFAQLLCKKQKKQNNLAYAISAKFPPKIKKQVQSIIDYYENQLIGQRNMFWKMTQTLKRQKSKEDFSFNIESSTIVDTTQKDDRISQLEDKLLQKDEKIMELNKDITILSTKYAKLKKQVISSPVKSIKSFGVTDFIKEQQ